MSIPLLFLQSTHLDPDDPTGSYMLQAGARFCKCLGSEFLPYLPLVMPQLLQSASLSPDVTVREQDDNGEDIEEEDEEDEEVLDSMHGFTFEPC